MILTCHLALLKILKTKSRKDPSIFVFISNYCLYKTSVILLRKENCDYVNAILTTSVKSYDDLLYICKTSDKAMKKKLFLAKCK